MTVTGMVEYVEREAAIEAIVSEPTDAHYPQWYADKIKAIPAADVATVRHGRWELTGADKRGRGGNWKCTGRDGCGKSYPYKCDFCPNCGAKMDLEEQHDQRRSNSDS